MNSKKIDKDLDSYLKGEKLAREVADIMSGEGEGQVPDTLLDVMLNNSYAADFVSGVSDGEYFAKEYNEVCIQKKQHDIERLVSRLRRDSSHTIFKSRVLRSIFYVAALIAVSFLVLYSLENNSSHELKLVSASGVSSYINSPVLIKEDGTVVDLLQVTPSENEEINEDDVTTLISKEQRDKQEKAKIAELEKIIVPRSYTYTYLLSDSTEVCLNAGSELIFPTQFFGDTREVTLKGEAFFKVSKSSKPFIVNTSHAKVKVYGTEFNINTDMNGTVETVLLCGSVGVTYKDHSEVKIAPNQLIRFNLNSGQQLIQDVCASSYIGWVDGYFLYENGSFDRIIADLSAWYGIEIYASLDVLEQTQLSFSINRDTPMDRMMSIIEDIANVKFINEGGGRYTIE